MSSTVLILSRISFKFRYKINLHQVDIDSKSPPGSGRLFVPRGYSLRNRDSTSHVVIYKLFHICIFLNFEFRVGFSFFCFHCSKFCDRSLGSKNLKFEKSTLNSKLQIRFRLFAGSSKPPRMEFSGTPLMTAASTKVCAHPARRFTSRSPTHLLAKTCRLIRVKEKYQTTMCPDCVARFNI